MLDECGSRFFTRELSGDDGEWRGEDTPKRSDGRASEIGRQCRVRDEGRQDELESCGSRDSETILGWNWLN